MTSFEELRDTVGAATAKNDAGAILTIADQLQMLNTDEAHALASRSRGYAYRLTGRFPEAIEANTVAIDLYERLNDQLGVAASLVNLAVVLMLTEEGDQAVAALRRAYDLYQLCENTSGMANALTTLGTYYARGAKYQQALDHYQRGLDLYEEAGDRFGIANTVSNIGLLHHNVGERTKALRYDFRALAMHEDNGDMRGAANVNSNIANLYYQLGSYPEALNYAYRSIECRELLGDRHGLAGSMLTISIIHNALKNTTDALSTCTKSLELYEELGITSGIADALNNLGTIYYVSGDHEAALDAFERSLHVARSLSTSVHRDRALVNIVDVNLNFGRHDEARRHLALLEEHEIVSPEARLHLHELYGDLYCDEASFEEAANAYHRALDIAVQLGARAEHAVLHKKLRDLAQKRNDFAGYIEHNEAHARIIEEIQGQDAVRRSALAVAEREFRTERAEHEKHKTLLYNTLPKAIADRVLRGEQVNDSIDHAAIMFVDLAGFTTMSSSMSASDVVDILASIFTSCDEICTRHGVMKIKTIGDSYMAAALPEQPNNRITEQPNVIPSRSPERSKGRGEERMNDAVSRITLAAQEIMSAIQNSKVPLQARIGLHCGPVHAGVIGTERMQYDVWGDTVNVASRMESTGEPGRIHVSEQFAHDLQRGQGSQFPVSSSLTKRGVVDVKGKGPMTTYFLT